MLSEKEKIRYNRHIILPQIGIDGQIKLKNAKVVVIGAGGLGSPVLQYLAAAGVGVIGIVDNDIVDESNLQRQILYTTNDIGKPKVEVAKRNLTALNPNVEIKIYKTFLTSENAEDIISKYDIVVDCPDNYETRYITSKACVKLGKPHVFGAISEFEGQLSVFNYNKGPTYQELFPDVLEQSQIDNNASAKGVIGVLPGVIGSLQANETIKIITGAGEILSGKLFIINLNNLFTNIINI